MNNHAFYLRISLLVIFFSGGHLFASDNGQEMPTHNPKHATANGQPHHHQNLEPIGLLGAHLHPRGDRMISYRYMHMGMRSMQDGTKHLSKQTVLRQFMVTPTKMSTDMHMIGLMYAPTERATFMLMSSYVTKEMKLQNRMRRTFTTNAEGFSDLKLDGLFRLYTSPVHRWHWNAGISLPTGSITERDDTLTQTNAKLPYPMQIGSGTWDFRPGITYSGHLNDWLWGAQLRGDIRLGRNAQGYSLGDRTEFHLWGGRKWGQYISTTFRLSGKAWGNVNGQDDDLNPRLVATADPDRQAGSSLDALIGITVSGVRDTAFAQQRLAIEVGAPIDQNLDGPQMKKDWTLTVGWQWSF